MMNNSCLTELSLEFAEKILGLTKELESKKEYLIAKQIGKSGTSIGANIYEAQYGQSKLILYLSSK